LISRSVCRVVMKSMLGYRLLLPRCHRVVLHSRSSLRHPVRLRANAAALGHGRGTSRQFETGYPRRRDLQVSEPKKGAAQLFRELRVTGLYGLRCKQEEAPEAPKARTAARRAPSGPPTDCRARSDIRRAGGIWRRGSRVRARPSAPTRCRRADGRNCDEVLRLLDGLPLMASTFGYSKDHWFDLKQLLFILTVTANGNIPVAHRLIDGAHTVQVFDVPLTDLRRQLLGLLGVLEDAFRPPD